MSITATAGSAESPRRPAGGGRLRFTLKKGLDVPLAGAPEQILENAPDIRTAAVNGLDYPGLKPAMAVKEGDPVKLGQVLFTDKKNPEIRFTSPACGKVAETNRGEKRILETVVIEVRGDEEETFESFPESELKNLSREQVTKNLLASGLWTALRARPYGKVPPPSTEPRSLFVNAMDTNPLAAPPARVIKEREADFINGLTVVSKLTKGRLYLCHETGRPPPGADLQFVTPAEFSGPHPAGLPGTHIHFIDPAGMNKTVWHLGCQDVMAIGALFTTGRLNTERIISLAGPGVKRPRLLRARLGASTNDLTRNELTEEENRVISGSVLSGRQTAGPRAYLGRYHLQISVLPEGRNRVFMEWLLPGLKKFSIKPVFLSRFLPGGNYTFTTSAQGSSRAMVPIGMYEKVMPLDLMPTFLLRALIVKDIDAAITLGALELVEEDLALCSFVCPGKSEYGPLLREILNIIEKEG